MTFLSLLIASVLFTSFSTAKAADAESNHITQAASKYSCCLACCCCCCGVGYLMLGISSKNLRRYAEEALPETLRLETPEQPMLYTCCWNGTECCCAMLSSVLFLPFCSCCEEDFCKPHYNCQGPCPKICPGTPFEGGCNNMCCWRCCPLDLSARVVPLGRAPENHTMN